MKKYMNFDTHEVYTLEELQHDFELFQHETTFTDFAEYMDNMLALGFAAVGGLVEIETDPENGEIL